MELIKFDAKRCSLCGKCVEKCPFGALSFEDNGIVVGDTCRMCGMCVRQCPEKAISFEQKAGSFDKDKWKDFLIFVEQERGDIHPVAFELIGEARKMASKVNFKVKCVIAGGAGTIENAHKLLDYGVDQVFAYEDESLEGFRADCYTDVVAECIAAQKPSSVLIGATALGRSLAPRLATRFHTGLTADCTTLDIKSNTDMVQIRPAFGGNIMAQISITKSRPQFATVRYRVMDAAQKVDNAKGEVVVCPVKEEMKQSPIEILKSEVIEKTKNIEDEDVLVVAGRGVRNDHMALRGFHVQMQSSLPVLHILQSLILEQQHHILPVQRNLPSFLQELLLVLPTQMPHVLAFLRYYNLKLHFLMPLLQLLLLHDQVLLCLMHHT